MPKPDLTPPLSDWAAQLDGLEWTALITDPEWRLMWVSRSLQNFLHVDDTTDLGYGDNVAWAWSTMEIWRPIVNEQKSQKSCQLAALLCRLRYSSD